MLILHDPAVRASLESRLQTLTSRTKPRWGKMSVDQMLWHMNQALAVALGDIQLDRQKAPIPAGVLKFVVLRLPWMKGAPTLPAFVAKGAHDFDAERARCLSLVGRFGAKPIAERWPVSPILGPVTGTEISQLQAKHLDHHLKQFGV